MSNNSDNRRIRKMKWEVKENEKKHNKNKDGNGGEERVGK